MNKITKFLIAIAAAILTAAALAACTEKPQSQSSETDPGSVGLPNPMVEYSNPDFTEAAGFAIAGHPGSGDLVVEHYWLIDKRIAQIDYILEGNFEATLRVAVDTGEDISGVYDTFEETVTEEVEGRMVTMSASPGGPALSTWTDRGYAYSLYFPVTEMGMAGGLTYTFVTQMEMSPEDAPDL